RPLIAYAYGDTGNLVRGTDAYKHKLSFEYDAANRLIRRTDRRGYSFLYEYAKDGRCLRSRGEDGLHEVHLRFLPGGGGTVVTKADRGEWLYVANEAGEVNKIVDPYGGIQLYE